MGNRPRFGDDRFALLREPRLAGGAAIEQGEAELRLQRVDRIADGGGGAPQALGGCGEAARFGHGEQHQKLIDTRYARAAHFKFLEKNVQFYTDFFRRENSYLLPKVANKDRLVRPDRRPSS